VKNKVAPPFRACTFDIMYNEGISISGDLVDLGTEVGVIKKSGNSYTYGDIKLGVGRENAKNTLKADPKLVAKLKKEVAVAARAAEENTEKEKVPAKA